ncbi:PIR protein [Plasmodium vivax]|uniref:VIR protein n=1 Tax=Plasmodium vivax TaxID=5855 RepID=A0A565A6C2_PLAVI|nr:PIR protein [Plasmodium vivax]
MDHSVYTYVKKFPKFDTVILGNSHSSSSPNYTKCEEFRTSKLNNCTSECKSFSITCTKIADLTEKIIGEAHSSKPAFCKYISYWFYDMLKSTQKSSHYDLLTKFYREFDNLKECIEYHKKKINERIHGELKDLYNLYNDFNNFRTKSLDKSRQQCDHGTNIDTIYKTHVKNCKQNYKNGLCINLINFKYEYDDHRSNAKSCLNEMIYLDPIKTDTEAIILLPFVTMTLISFILIFLYKFTSFGSWIRPKLGGKNRTNKLDKNIQELQNTSEVGGRRYKIQYHSSHS